MASSTQRHLGDHLKPRNLQTGDRQPKRSPQATRQSAVAPAPIPGPSHGPSVACGHRLIPPSLWSQYHPWPPIGGLRHLIFHAKSNGFDQVVRRVGRRVLIDEQAFFAWVEQSGGAK